LGYEAGEKKEAKVFIYAAGSTTPFRYEGINKFDSLSKFFDSVIDGTADLTVINEEAKAEEYVPTPEEIEIEQKQEAQRMALAHGGFNDLIDFEKAIKEGAGADYHDVNGFPGMMGSPPPAKTKSTGETPMKQKPAAKTPEPVVKVKEEEPVNAQEEPVEIVETQVEEETDDAEPEGEVESEQIVFDAPKEIPNSVPVAGECAAPSADTPADSASECSAPKVDVGSERPKDEL